MEKAFSAKAKVLGDRIVSDIKDQFIKKLEKTTWMEQEVIDLAIRKVHNIVQKIGYPTKVRALLKETLILCVSYLFPLKLTTTLPTEPKHSRPT